MRVLLTLGVLMVASSASAQVFSRPTEPPPVDASSQAWFRLREPIQFGGDAYYPAGAAVFFNGRVMVRTAHYNGIPVYVDATLEPYSVLYVPMGRGLMQPYERPRRGALAGTVGSRVPSFPISLLPDGPVVPMTAVSPTQLPVSIGAIGALSLEPALAGREPDTITSRPLAETTPAFQPALIISPQRPTSNDGVWFTFDSQRWVTAGRAEARSAAFTQVGTYAGFPVFRRPGVGDDTIFVPTRDGWLAPYRRKG